MPILNLAAVGLALISLLAARAHAAPAQISGVVLDPSGKVVAGAQVRLTLPDGNQLAAATGLDGAFSFPSLAPAEYRLRVEHPGFRVVERRLRLSSAPARLNITLQIAELRQSLDVGKSKTEVSSDPAENLDIIKLDRQTLRRLPVMGNDVVGAAAQFLDQGAVGVGGVSLMVDGVEARKVGVSASAIQEIRINQNPYSAEFERPGRGRIEVTTLAAAPKLHGSVEFVFRDARLDARNAFAATRPAEQRRILEGSLTGPASRSKKTRFLFSGNHEEEDLQNLVFAITPSGVLRQNAPEPTRQTEGSFSLTRDISDTQRLTGRYEWTFDQTEAGGVGEFVLPESGRNYYEREHVLFADHTASLSPHVVHQLRLRAGIENYSIRSLLQGAPRIVVQDAFTGGGAQADRRQSAARLSLTEIVSFAAGRHLLRAGVSVPAFTRHGLSDRTNFDGTYTFASLADYAAGRPMLFEVQRGNGYVQYWEHAAGLFLVDDFKPRPNLSLSLGLRYDWQRYVPAGASFGPRLSLAWSPDKRRKTVVRAGAGVFYERTGGGAIADLQRFNGKGLQRLTLSDPIYPGPLPAGAALASQPGLVTRFDGRLRLPALIQYSATVERQVRKSLVASAGYTGSAGVRQFRSRDANAPLPPLFAARPRPEFGILRVVESAGRLRSHSLDLSLRGSISEFVTCTVQHTWAWAWNDTGGIGWFPASSFAAVDEWSRAPFDVRHRFRGLTTMQAGDLFDLGLIFSWQSGAPYTLTTGRDDNRDGRATDRPPGVGRNTRQGFASAGLDARITREFKLARGDRDDLPAMELSVESFNLLNRVNFSNVVGNLSSPFFGQPVAARPARRMQLRLEFRF